MLSNAISIALQFILVQYQGRLAFLSPKRMAIGESIAFIGVFVAGLLMARLERRKFGEYGLPAKSAAPSRLVVKYVRGGLVSLTIIE